MKKLMEQLFARQKAELDEEIRKRAEPAGRPAPAAAAPEAKQKEEFEAKRRAELEAKQKAERQAQAAHKPAPPLQVAAAKPSALAAAPVSPLPQPGDTWTYQRTDLKKQEVHEFKVDVKFSSESGVVDGTPRRSDDQWAWSPGAQIVGSRGLAVLSPYLFVLGKHAPGKQWKNVQYRRYCAGSGPQDCEFDARYIGRERVTVPAGTFDAHKVEITENLYENVGGKHWHNYRRLVTLWYADEAKRFVKATRRSVSTSRSRGDFAHDLDFELLAYKLN